MSNVIVGKGKEVTPLENINCWSAPTALTRVFSKSLGLVTVDSSSVTYINSNLKSWSGQCTALPVQILSHHQKSTFTEDFVTVPPSPLLWRSL